MPDDCTFTDAVDAVSSCCISTWSHTLPPVRMEGSHEEKLSTGEGMSRQPQQELMNGKGSRQDSEARALNGVPPQGTDEVIGLQFTNGRIFYLHRSTLMRSSGYFAKKFGGAEISPSDNNNVARDTLGRRVYFFERDCQMFEDHILPFILTKKPGKLPPFSQDRGLWRDLRKEAEYFDIHGLLRILYVTHLCPPSDSMGHGIFYYVGTNNGTSRHWNHQAIGLVNVRKDPHYMSPEEQATILGNHSEEDSYDKVLVQYQPTTAALESMSPSWAAAVGVCTVPQTLKSNERCRLFSCGGSSNNAKQIPALVHFRTVTVRLVAYALHKDAAGMKNWTVEGSLNGKDWKMIHTAPGNANLMTTFTEKEKDAIKSQMDMIKSDIMTVPGESDYLQKLQIILDEAENSNRHVWTISKPAPDFYSFFRIVAVGDDSSDVEEEDVDESQSTSMTKRAFRRLGLELFGEVHEG